MSFFGHERRGETNCSSALEVARKLRSGIAQTPFKVDFKTVRVTASFCLCGTDRIVPGDRRLAERMLKVADQALYRSKSAGLDRLTATSFPLQADRSPPTHVEPSRAKSGPSGLPVLHTAARNSTLP